MKEQGHNIPVTRMRRFIVLALLAMGVVLLGWRAVYLQVFNTAFLKSQGQSRHLRSIAIPAHRGVITDRNGELLAISTPVSSVWVNPQELIASRAGIPALARVLDLAPDRVRRLLARYSGREFVYLKRHVNPDVAARVRALKLPGVYLMTEYRRYYPTGEVAAHVVGFTDIDDGGQEGMELAFNKWLTGVPGRKRVIKDRLGRTVEDVERIRASRPGKDLRLSIDKRLQYLLYRELKAAVIRHRARSGSAVILDARTGEVLALVNQPSYNPNNRRHLRGDRYRNRAVTDVFEPGSTIKPFTVVAALQSGKYRAGSLIDTSPGYIRVGRNTIRDHRNYGVVDMTHLLSKSSNVGATRLALSLRPEQLWGVFTRLGFGQVTGSGFPGEVGGLLMHYRRWHEIERVTMSFGYGLSVTPLQLARAYAVLANDGRLVPVSFVRRERPVQGRQVIPVHIARQVRRMLEAVVSRDGTGHRARVPGYRVAGKTGTTHKSTAGGYAEDRYVSVFAGMIPASHPRLVMVVMINEPTAGEYYGGAVAAPVFARVMTGAMRLLDIPPDDNGVIETRARRAGRHS